MPSIAWQGQLRAEDDNVIEYHNVRLVVSDKPDNKSPKLERLDGQDAMGVERWVMVEPERYAGSLLDAFATAMMKAKQP